MLTFIARRMLRALVTFTICVSVVFMVLRLAGDPTDILLPDDTPPEVKAEYREHWGTTGLLPSNMSAFWLRSQAVIAMRMSEV